MTAEKVEDGALIKGLLRRKHHPHEVAKSMANRELGEIAGED